MTQKTIVFIGAVVCAVSLLMVATSSQGEQEPATASGARTIDASAYRDLQAALDAIGPTGGVLRIPPGEYLISKPLTLSVGDVSLEGSGSATHIKNINVDGEPAILLEPPKGTKSIWRIRIANLRLTGNEKSGHGIVARRIDEFFAESITVTHHGGHGIFLDGCYEDARICDSLITYNKKTGLDIVDCHDIVVASNHFEENQDALRCIDSFNLCMNGNNIDDHLGNGIVIVNTYGSVVSGNMIEECQGIGVVLDRDCYGITLSANVIAHDFGGGIELRDAHGCAVSANTFVLVGKRALFIGPNSGRITVTGNNFSDSYIGGGREKRAAGKRGANGIVLDATSAIIISGNLFSGLDTKAIDFDPNACRQIEVSSNVIVDCLETTP